MAVLSAGLVHQVGFATIVREEPTRLWLRVQAACRVQTAYQLRRSIIQTLARVEGAPIGFALSAQFAARVAGWEPKSAVNYVAAISARAGGPL